LGAEAGCAERWTYAYYIAQSGTAWISSCDCRWKQIFDPSSSTAFCALIQALRELLARQSPATSRCRQIPVVVPQQALSLCSPSLRRSKTNAILTRRRHSCRAKDPEQNLRQDAPHQKHATHQQACLPLPQEIRTASAVGQSVPVECCETRERAMRIVTRLPAHTLSIRSTADLKCSSRIIDTSEYIERSEAVAMCTMEGSLARANFVPMRSALGHEWRG
jgi:hypothetical protein